MRKVLIAILEEIERQREESVTKREFLEFARKTEENFQKVWEAIKDLAEAQRRTEGEVAELRATVKELAEAQKRTEQRVNELAEAQKRTEEKVNQLAEAQRRNEQEINDLKTAVKDLAEAQKRTEQRVNELAEAQKRTEEEIRKLSKGLQATRDQLGGLSRSVAYALENEAYVRLPEYLRKHYGIEITERFVRTDIRDEEINLFARGRRNGKDVVVGESVLKLDDIEKVRWVLEKVDIVMEETGPEVEIIPIIVTHFAKRKVLEAAQKRGIIVVQSFQW